MELTVIVPTYNEKENIKPLIEALEKALVGKDWDVLFVDDNSLDGTAGEVENCAQNKPYVRLFRRQGKRGLSASCIEGMKASPAPYLAVMDADRQHDESILPKMLEELKKGDYDIVIGSRYAEGGSAGDFKRSRRMISSAGTKLAGWALGREIKDPLSGFFMLRRELFEDVKEDLSGRGFKILLDILLSSRKDVRFQEIPYTFRPRVAGESKLSWKVSWEYFWTILEKSFRRLIR